MMALLPDRYRYHLDQNIFTIEMHLHQKTPTKEIHIKIKIDLQKRYDSVAARPLQVSITKCGERDIYTPKEIYK